MSRSPLSGDAADRPAPEEPGRRPGEGAARSATEADEQGPGRDGAGDDRVITAVEFANVLLRHRKAVVGLPIALASLVSVLALTAPRTYTSEASFMPAREEAPSAGVTGLAARLGVSVGAANRGEQRPRFYADLIRSRELLHSVVRSTYRIDEETGDGSRRSALATLVEHYEVTGADSAAGVELAARELRRRIDVTTRPETWTVHFAVRDLDPAVARQIADRILELVNRFNVETWQTQAGAERRFIKERLADAREDLRAAEGRLERFLTRNRRYQGSPELRFEHERLRRQVSLRQELYTSLSESYYDARIRETRDTPVITVVDPPEVPPIPDRRFLLVRGLLSLIAGGLLAVLWAFAWEFGRSTPGREPDAYWEFLRLREETLAELERWLGPLGRRLRRMVGPRRDAEGRGRPRTA